MSCIKYNNVIDVQYEPVDPNAYPVSLADMKRHLYLQFDSEGGFSVDDDDTYIENELIPAATASIEKYTGVLLRPCNVSAVIRNDKGGQQFPYGPVSAFTTLSDANGEAVDAADYKLQGLQFKTLKSPCGSEFTGVYTAGYAAGEVPASLRMAVLHQGAFLYKARGDQQQQYASADVDMSTSAKALANPYRRVLWLL